MAGRSDDEIRCSFCGKSQGQVRKLIAGPKGAYICDECVDICAEIIEEEFENEEETGAAEETEQINLLKPEELKSLSGRLCDRTGSGEKGSFRCSI